MRSHRLVKTLWVALIASGMTMVAFSTSEAQVIQMKFAHYAEETHPGHMAAKQFASRV